MRTVSVDAVRMERWAAGFGERHGGPVRSEPAGADLLLTAADGATARLVFPAPSALPDGTAFDSVAGFVAAALLPRRTAVVLARRGGYACLVVEGERILASKVGTRYVQGRTAAGGWSQQRFARRRANQTEELALACLGVAERLLLPADAELLATGGDRPLVDRVVEDPRLRALAALPRGPHLAVGDPRSDVVRAVPDLLRRVSVRIEEAG